MIIGNVVQRAKTFARDRVGPVVADRQPRRVDLPLDTWGLTVGANGHLCRAGADLVELTERFGSPLQLVDAAMLDRIVDEAMAPIRSGGDGADIFYSYKTNPVPGVLRFLHERGVGAEVISPFELWLAMRLGVPAERIIYNGPAKSFESLRTAVRAGVALINANSAGDIDLIRHAARAEDAVANVGFRISLPTMWQGQFGLTAHRSAAAIATALDDPHLSVKGLHFHNGFSLRTEAQFSAYVSATLDHCDHVHAQTGWSPSIVDLGGSLCCPTVTGIPTREFRLNRALGTDLLPPDPASCISIGSASGLAARMVRERFESAGRKPPSVVLEPGRSLTSSAQMLLTTVHDVKTDGALPHAVLDAGINIAEPATTEYHQLFSASAPSAPASTSYRLVGPICTPADVLCNNWRLPALQPGHVLAVMDSGAYFVPFSTSFSFPRPAIVLVGQDGVTVMRQRETFADIVSLDEPLDERVGEPASDR